MIRIPRQGLKGLVSLIVLLGLLLAACGGGDSEAGLSDADTGDAGQAVQTQPAPTSTNTPIPPTPPQEPTSTTLPGEPTSTPRPTFTPVPTDTPAPPPPPTDTPEPVQAEQSEPENPAPEFGSINGWYNGKPTTLAELRGQPVLLVFWADF